MPRGEWIEWGVLLATGECPPNSYGTVPSPVRLVLVGGKGGAALAPHAHALPRSDFAHLIVLPQHDKQLSELLPLDVIGGAALLLASARLTRSVEGGGDGGLRAEHGGAN